MKSNWNFPTITQIKSDLRKGLIPEKEWEEFYLECFKSKDKIDPWFIGWSIYKIVVDKYNLPDKFRSSNWENVFVEYYDHVTKDTKMNNYSINFFKLQVEHGLIILFMAMDAA